MRIPLTYNLRNLTVRKTTTLMTAIGIALTVAVLVADLALVEGLSAAFKSSANPLQVVVMRKGSNAELTSLIPITAWNDLKLHPGIQRNGAGDSLASLEIVTVINLPSVENPDGMNLTVRGLRRAGRELRGVNIKEGRWFSEGRREVVVGKSVAKRYPNTQLGKKLRFGAGEWDVVGVMDAGESAIESEIWADFNQIAADYNRQDAASSIRLRAVDQESVPALINSINDDRRLSATAIRETEYYEKQTSAGEPLRLLGIFVCAIMAIGSSFAAMNTMYAAVARRTREIGTLRVLGFSRSEILFSFLLESLLIALLGGIIGWALVLPLNNLTTGVGSLITFSEVSFNFNVGPNSLMAGLIFSASVGIFGGMFPAFQAARKEILTALREI
jgi:putative ABC transport system permease protein